MLYAVVWNYSELPKKEALLVRSESALKEAADSDRCIIIEGTVRTCSRTESGTRYTADGLVICEDGQSTWQAGSEKEGEAAQQAVQTGSKTISAKRRGSEQENKTDSEAVVTEAEKKETVMLPKSHGILFTFTQEETAPEIGDRVRLSGELQLFESAGNPGQFDARSYYRRRNVVCQLKKPCMLWKKSGNGGIRRALQRLRGRLDDSCLNILEEEDARTLAALAFGEKAWMDSGVKTQYQEGGIAHIASISGLHLSMLGAGLYQVLRRCIPGIPAAALLSGTIMAGFTVMTGGSVSALRAFLMFCVWLGAQVFGRKYDGKTALGFAGSLLLLCDPQNLTDTSFLLSFAAVICLAFLIPELIRGFGAEQSGKAVTAVLSGFGIWFGMLPLTLRFFYQTPVYSIFLNLIVVALVPAVMGSGMAGAVIGVLFAAAGIFLAAPVHYLLWMFGKLCDFMLLLPGALQILGCPGIRSIVLYYGIILAAVCTGRQVKRKNLRRIIWLLCIVLGIGVLQPSLPKQVEILCMDVGQGDGTLFRMPGGEVCLIDGGSSSEKQIWKGLGQTLRYYGVDTVDYVFLSHADADHTNGIEQYLLEYQCNLIEKNSHGITLKNLVLPPTAKDDDFQKIRELAASNGIRIFQMKAGSEIRGSAAKNWRFSCLSPDESELTGDKNEDSMVLLFQYGEFRMLFTGDLEGAAEKKLAETYQKALRADVLKVGHHGSKNGSSEPFLAQVSPRVSVISCGAKNRYGHPSPETVTRLEAVGSEIHTTAVGGAIRIATDGRYYTVTDYRAPEKNIKN